MVNTYLWLNTHTELGLPVVCIVGGTTSPLACCRLRDGGGKSFSNKKCEKRVKAAPFPKSCVSYFHFARFNTFPLYYLRAWHRLPCPPLYKHLFSQLCGTITLLAQDISLSDFAILLILRCSFQWCQRIFLNWP